MKLCKSALPNDRKSVVTERSIYIFHSIWSQLEMSENRLVQNHSMFILKTNSSSRINFLFHLKQGASLWTFLIIDPFFFFFDGRLYPHYCLSVSQHQRSLHYALAVCCLECAPIYPIEAFVTTESTSAFPLMDCEHYSKLYKMSFPVF